MANTHTTLAELFQDIATTIRGKTGGTGPLVADNFPSAIDGIVTLKDGSADATALESHIASPYTAYAQGVKLTGTVPEVKSGEETDVGQKVASKNTLVKEGPFCWLTSGGAPADALLRTGAKPKISFFATQLGSAKVDQVAAGVLFSSSTGIKATGTGKLAHKSGVGNSKDHTADAVTLFYMVDIADPAKTAIFTEATSESGAVQQNLVLGSQLLANSLSGDVAILTCVKNESTQPVQLIGLSSHFTYRFVIFEL